MPGILGRKVGMTQIFNDDGRAVPVTLIHAGPCVVLQRKTHKTDGYEAVQVGLVEAKAPRKVTKPQRGHFKKAGADPVRSIAEFRVDEGDELTPGDEIKVSAFAENDIVDIVGTSKGKGFQGVMKRHNFGGGRATHGSMFHRAPGSIGQASYPSRVFPGVKLPGQMGNKRITAKNLRVVKIDEEQNLLYIRGAVPGARGSYVSILSSKKG